VVNGLLDNLRVLVQETTLGARFCHVPPTLITGPVVGEGNVVPHVVEPVVRGEMGAICRIDGVDAQVPLAHKTGCVCDAAKRAKQSKALCAPKSDKIIA